MNRRLKTHIESDVSAVERVSAKPTTVRAKTATQTRLNHAATRSKAHKTKPDDTSMDYQMGFTSGPSV